jgi:hypothetical protein
MSDGVLRTQIGDQLKLVPFGFLAAPGSVFPWGRARKPLGCKAFKQRE